MVVVTQRGLTTRSYGVQDAGTPGDLVSIDFGSFTRRPYGPKLIGWNDDGWSAHNSSTNARHVFSITSGLPERTVGMYWEVYKFGEWSQSGASNKLVNLCRVKSDYGGNETFGFDMNVETMALNINSLNAIFPAQNNVRTIPRHLKWCAFSPQWEKSGGLWTLRFQYLESGMSNPVTLYTTSALNLFGFEMIGINGGILWQNGAQIAARIGLPTLCSAANMAEMGFPADMIMPPALTWSQCKFGDPTFPFQWHVKTSAAGGGNGNTKAAAWTPAEFKAEMGTTLATASKYTITSGVLIDATDSVVNTALYDASILCDLIELGVFRFTGDRVFFDDDTGAIRFDDQIVFNTCVGAVFDQEPGLDHIPEIRKTSQQISGWTLHSGSVWRKAWTEAFSVAVEYDSLAEADTRYANPRWLAHPTAADITAYMASGPPAGSFHMSGGFFYIRLTDSSNPNLAGGGSTGKVVEVTHNADFTDLFTVVHRDICIRNLALRLCAAVDNTNSGGSAATGRNLAVIDNQSVFYGENLVIYGGGKHGDAWVPARFKNDNSTTTDAPSRFITNNCTYADHRPPEYGGFGGSTMTVEDGHDSPLTDAQFWRKNCKCLTNCAQVGSKVGVAELTQATSIQHNDTNGNFYPFTKGGWVGTEFCGLFLPGSVTVNLTVDNCPSLGTPLADLAFGSKNNTITRSKLVGRSVSVGNGIVPQAGTHSVLFNEIVLAGAIAGSGTLIGTVTIAGNTIDASTLTGGTTKAIWTRQGAAAVITTISGNIVIQNAADAFRFLGTITTGSGDSLTMRDNMFQQADATRIITNSYNGATQTIAQHQAGGQDVGSNWTTNVKADPNLYYQLAADSPARGFVDTADVPAMSGGVDFDDRQRPTFGKQDAGAVAFKNRGATLTRLRQVGSHCVRVGRKF